MNAKSRGLQKVGPGPKKTTRRNFLKGAAASAAAVTGAGLLSGPEASHAQAPPVLQNEQGLLHPHGVAVSGNGNIYVCDSGNYRIQILTADLKPVSSFGKPGYGPGLVNYPTGIEVAPDGSIYVADTNNGRICHFNESGLLLGEFGGIGGAPGSFYTPQGVRLFPDGRILVINTRGHNLQIFDQDRFQVQDVWGYLGDDETEVPAGDRLYHFRLPTDAAIDDDGNVWVLDSKHGSLVKLDGKGGFLARYPKSKNTVLNQPQSMVFSGGMLYVCDTGNSRVAKFNRAGQYVEARTGGMNRPTGIAAIGDSLIVTDNATGAVQLLEVF